MSRACEVRYIITVNALKEGWDCPFAYILATLAYQTNWEYFSFLLQHYPYLLHGSLFLLNPAFCNERMILSTVSRKSLLLVKT